MAKQATTEKGTAARSRTRGASQAARNIGIDVPAPERTCDDGDCPFHGTLRVRGFRIAGKVVSSKMDKTAVVEREHLRFVPKYERYERRTGRYAAHNPPCIAAQPGDDVTLMECRPLSKTKSFAIVAARRGQMRVVGEDYTEGLREARATPPSPGGEGA